ncbi:hypothetical protein YC2023_023946 [Brassica napus]
MNLQASATSRDAEDSLFFRMPRFLLEMFVGLKMFRDVARVLAMRLRNILDRGVAMFRIALEALLRIFPYMPRIMVWVDEKDVFTQIAKDVVGQG